MKSELEVGEWQIDEQGRRFRRIGKYGKEFAPQLLTTFGMLDADIAASVLAAERQGQKTTAQEPEKPKYTCPFRSGMKTDCTGEQCALYASDGCSLAALGDNATTNDTAGKSCPLNGFKSVCRSSCVLYSGGCTLTTINGKDD